MLGRMRALERARRRTPFGDVDDCSVRGCWDLVEYADQTAPTLQSTW